LQKLLDVRELTVAYGQIEAVRDISLDVLRDEIVCLIGSNGAGKSTLIKAILGLARLKKGSVSFEGKEIGRLPVETRVKLGVVLVPEGRMIISSLSVLDNLMLGTFPHRREMKRQIISDLEYVYHLFPILKERQRQLGGTLSGGEQQMLAIGRGLLARPNLLMLDEPSLGLAPLIIGEVFGVIKKLQEKHMGILLVEQNAKLALQVSNKGFVIETGCLRLKGNARELIQNSEVINLYLSGGPRM
jgi:branched-chain amino acid transport system ATP-binding protein